MIDCAILGAYPHATTIAPNNVRKKVYAGKVNYSAVVNACSSRGRQSGGTKALLRTHVLAALDLFNIVAEFVIAITMLHPALSHAVSYNPDWKDYKTAAVTEVPRTKLFKLALGDRNVVQPRRSRVSGAGEAARNDVSSASGFPAIVKVSKNTRDTVLRRQLTPCRRWPSSRNCSPRLSLIRDCGTRTESDCTGEHQSFANRSCSRLG